MVCREFNHRKFIFCVSLIMVMGSYTSKGQIVDTIKYSLQQKPKVFATLANFNTFIDHQYANIFRVKAGLTYNQKIRFGIGYSNLANNSVITTIHINEDNLDYYTNGKLSYSSFSVSAEYFFFDKYPWQCTVTPFQIGVGGASYEYFDRTLQTLTNTASETIILYQPEVSAQYSIFTWFGVGATVGYRLTLYRSQKLIQNLDAPTFAIDFRLFLDEIYKELFEKE
jgi:hypothetical protein